MFLTDLVVGMHIKVLSNWSVFCATFYHWHARGGYVRRVLDLLKAIVYLSDSTMWGIYVECVYGSFGGMVLF
jgi:hypothetical protein